LFYQPSSVVGRKIPGGALLRAMLDDHRERLARLLLVDQPAEITREVVRREPAPFLHFNWYLLLSPACGFLDLVGGTGTWF